MDDNSNWPPPAWEQWRSEHDGWVALTFLQWCGAKFIHWGKTSQPVAILEIGGKFTVLVAAVAWLYGCHDRQKEKHFRAWSVINSARDASGDGGRLDALVDLNSDKVPL